MATVFTRIEKGEDIVNVELAASLFYEEEHMLYGDLTFHVTYKNGKILSFKINKVYTGIHTDQFTLSNNGTCNAIQFQWFNRLMRFDNYTAEILKEPDPIEVTIEEIEKKFGRKVKIVEKKEDEKDD